MRLHGTMRCYIISPLMPSATHEQSAPMNCWSASSLARLPSMLRAAPLRKTAARLLRARFSSGMTA